LFEQEHEQEHEREGGIKAAPPVQQISGPPPSEPLIPVP
jgi:hypothetical protein